VPLWNVRAETGLEARFEKLLAEHRGALGRIAWSYTNTAADREDLLQDMGMALWQALPGFRGECSERTFVYRIGHNRAVHFLAARRRADTALDDAIEASDPAPTAETELARQQQTEQLADAVRRLPLPYRQVVVLLLEGLEYAEIAEVLGISESNVGVRLNRARPMLRQTMGGRK
jgi:RNA polymerase sigma-70 factor (ECF subfamily)